MVIEVQHNDTISKEHLQELLEECEELKGSGELAVWESYLSLISELEYIVEFIQEGEGLIDEGYFQDYIKNSYITEHNFPPTILNNINWAGVEDDHYPDYTHYQLDGVTYLSRS